jgi:hypothetical protein
MKIPTSKHLLVYILETTIALHTLALLDLPAAASCLEYKLKGDVTLYLAMYGSFDLEPFWDAMAGLCNVLYDMRNQPKQAEPGDPRAKLNELRTLIGRKDTQ